MDDPKPYIEEIYDLLQKVKSPGTYCCGKVIEEICLPGLNIEGIGQIGLPLVEVQAKEIAKMCSLAPYGKKDETIYDTQVRNTLQLDPSKISFKNPKWKEFVKNIASQVCEDFGISSIRWSLYKLLLYEEGSFFKPHRDTEKEHRMFGTLVIQLPSEYEGGQLIVKHKGDERTFDFSKEHFNFSFAAFYADCQHEVKPLTKGFRLCLVYNLLHKGSGPLPAPADVSPSVNTVVKQLEKWRKDSKPLSKLAIKLHHKYSEEALSFNDLKNTDRYQAMVLRQACEEAKFSLHLAVLKIHEEDHNYNPYYDNGESEVTYTLESWTNVHDKEVNFGEMGVDEETEIMPQDLKDNLSPDSSDMEEGFYGNEGASKSWWYHTAVMVIWPQENEIMMKYGDISECFKKVEHWIQKIQSEKQPLPEIREVVNILMEKGSDPMRMLKILSDLKMVAEFTEVLMKQSELLTADVTSQNKLAAVLEDTCNSVGWKNMSAVLMKIVESYEDLDIIIFILAKLWNVKTIIQQKKKKKAKSTKSKKKAAVVNTEDKEAVLCDVLFKVLDKINPTTIVPDSIAILVSLVDTADSEKVRLAFKEALSRFDHKGLHEAVELLSKKSKTPTFTILLEQCIELYKKLTAAPVDKAVNYAIDVKLSCNKSKTLCQDCESLHKFLSDSTLKETRMKMSGTRTHHLESQIESHKIDVVHKIEGKLKSQCLVIQKKETDPVKQREKDVQVLQDLEALLKEEPKSKRQKTSENEDL